MKIEDLPVGHKVYTQLGQYVLAVLSRRVDGWCVYVGAVAGCDHSREWQAVASSGYKQNETVARAIVKTLFHPGFEVGELPYAR